MGVIGKQPICLIVLVLLFSTVAAAGDKKLMHCFVFTPLAEATAEDWEAFYRATDELPGKIEGLSAVWVGKLRQAKTQFIPDQQGNFHRRSRQYGVCMEMDDEAALERYADHPAHRAWVKVYEKVRQPVTFTFDILGR